MTEALDARIRKSQLALIRAGLTLLSRNSEASLSDIAREAGVGRTTLYRLYDSKEQLVKAIAVHCLQVFDEATAHLEREATSALQAFHLLFKAILPLAQEMEFLMKLGDLEEEDPEIIAIGNKQDAEIAELVEAAKQEGSLRKALPTAWVVQHFDGLLYSAWLMRQKSGLDHEALADLAFSTFCEGVAKS